MYIELFIFITYNVKHVYTEEILASYGNSIITSSLGDGIKLLFITFLLTVLSKFSRNNIFMYQLS